jgi:hypothetical protein
MGSFPYPPNGIVEIDYEFILLFKKPGRSRRIPREVKEASVLTRDEWKEYFTGHWRFAGERQVQHEAMFPEELPRRLIRMFSFVGETVLDPFVGSGTTVKVALALGRQAIGYEIQPDFVPLIRRKLCLEGTSLWEPLVTIAFRESSLPPVDPPPDYRPQIQDVHPQRDPQQFRFVSEATYKVVEILDERTLLLDSGLMISLLGIIIPPERKQEARAYLQRFLLGKRVLLGFDTQADLTLSEKGSSSTPLPVYLYLTNKLFVNRKMIEMGLAVADRQCEHRFRAKFLQAEEKQHG